MARSYAPSSSPGSVRTCTRLIVIRLPPDLRTDTEKEEIPRPVPQIDVFEREVVRLADREKPLEDLGRLPTPEFNPVEVIPLLDPETDLPTGETVSVGQIHAGIYSWIRAAQSARDLAEVSGAV